MLMILDSTKGKNDDFNESKPIIPKAKNAIINTFTAKWYFIK
jgi:hypothetical protein